MEPLKLALYPIIAVPALIYCYQRGFKASSVAKSSASKPASNIQKPSKAKPRKKYRDVVKEARRMEQIKTLYYKLQNLEQFPEVLPEARELLKTLLDEYVLLGKYKAKEGNRSILDIETFDAKKLHQFQRAEFQDMMETWESYVKRRKAGGAREFFPERQDAVKWLKDLAPLNYIDGAWLCRIHKITTPFALRGVTKDAWQTYSEEMGDGDLEKNHVVIYRKLMEQIGANLPPADSPDFIDPKHNMTDDGNWKASTAQMLVSLFPNDFLPEILGFNLHFEALTVNTLKAMQELPEHGLSPYYFTLHVSIDNADSGHSAMALATISRFMQRVKDTGMMDYDEAWRRVQAGYLLSQHIESDETNREFELRVADMLQKKASLARKIHCTSRVRIGERSLTDWFVTHWQDADAQPETSDSEEEQRWKEEFLDALADAKPWVYRGNSEKSLLMRELSWKGKMFGAFTNSEVETMRTWIDSLGTEEKSGSSSSSLDVKAAAAAPAREDVVFKIKDLAATHPVFPVQQKRPSFDKYGTDLIVRPPLATTSASLDTLLPLWFAHPCLVENTASSPHGMATPMASQILQILRAESGYMPESDGVAGMDEHLFATSSPDVVALGLAMMRRNGRKEPATLADVLSQHQGSESTAFAYDMLGWAMRPMENCMFLLGMARAFLDLETLVVNHDDWMAQEERDVLKGIVKRKEAAFEVCIAHVQKQNDAQRRELVAGYEFGRDKLEQLLA